MKSRLPGRLFRFLAMLVGLGFLGAGVTTMVAGVHFGLVHDAAEEIGAALFMGGALVVSGVIILIVVRRLGRQARRETDAASAAGLYGAAYHSAGELRDGADPEPWGGNDSGSGLD